MHRTAERGLVAAAHARPALTGRDRTCVATGAAHRSVHERRLAHRSDEHTEDRSRHARDQLETEVVIENAVHHVAAVVVVGREERDALDVVADLNRVGLRGRAQLVPVTTPRLTRACRDAATRRGVVPVAPASVLLDTEFGVLDIALEARKVEVLIPESQNRRNAGRNREGTGHDRVELIRNGVEVRSAAALENEAAGGVLRRAAARGPQPGAGHGLPEGTHTG